MTISALIQIEYILVISIKYVLNIFQNFNELLQHDIFHNLSFTTHLHFFNFNDFIIYLFFCLFAFSWAAPTAYGGSQVRGLIGAVATGLRQSHSNVGSKPHLQSTPELTATLDR